MRTAYWVTVLVTILPAIINCQAQNKTKPCIAYAAGNPTGPDTFGKQYLSTAVTLSGDFDYFDTWQVNCWNVHVLAMAVQNLNGVQTGYALSFTVTAPEDTEIDHELIVGQMNIFDEAMREAAATAMKAIRLRLELLPIVPTSSPSESSPKTKPNQKSKAPNP